MVQGSFTCGRLADLQRCLWRESVSNLFSLTEIRLCLISCLANSHKRRLN